jgi:hypothetical protein
MDKVEREEVLQRASAFVEPGFKLVAQEKVRSANCRCVSPQG